MPAYIIVKVSVTDPDQYDKYKQLTPAAIAAHGGKFIVRGGEHETLCLLYTSPSPRDATLSRMPSSA